MKEKNLIIKNKILKISRELFVENGFCKTGMREIAQKSDCSLANLYTYFKSKEEIFESIIIETRKKFIVMFRILINSEGKEKGKRLINKFILLKKDIIFLIFNCYRKNYDEKFNDFVNELKKEIVKFNKELDAENLNRIFVDIFISVFSKKNFSQGCLNCIFDLIIKAVRF